MVGRTRSGRAPRGQFGTVAPASSRPEAKPQGVTKTRARGAARGAARGGRARGRGRGGRGTATISAAADAAIEERTEHHAPEPRTPKTTSSEPAQPPPAPKVPRVYNEIWGSGLDSIAFVHENKLSTDDDTTTITLNLIDHIIKPENWNPDLSYNVLSATCFFFASKLTGHDRNTPDKISSAMKVDVHLLEAMAGPHMHYDPLVRARLAEALRVGPEDVKKGYGILWEQRESLAEYVGEYAAKLDKLPRPEDLGKMKAQKVMKGMGWKDGEGLGAGKKGIASPVKARERVFPEAGLGWKPEGAEEEEEEDQAEGNEEAAIEEEKASEVELDDVELDDFDRFVEENE